jgi:glycosyltransferase involved in cell wall biosynthesis
LVDDGSTDNSGKICDEYATKYDNIKAFHKENGGLSDARNYGTERISGDYLVFVDSDDYIDKKTLETYRLKALENNNPDIMIDQSNYMIDNNRVRLSNTFYDYTRFEKKSGKDAFAYIVSNCALQSAWGKCYKIEYWNEQGFSFTKGIYAEDLDLTYKVIYLADSVVMTPTMYYYREKREGSIVNTMNLDKFVDIFRIIDGWEDFFVKYNVDEQSQDDMYRMFGELIVYLIMGNVFYLNTEERKIIYNLIYHKKYILKKYNSILGKVTYISSNIMGIRATSFLVFYMKKMCLKFMKQ